MLDILTAKRAALQSSLEQIIGQANRVNGAIAVIDELLQEAAAVPKEEPKIGGIDRAPNEVWQKAAAAPTQPEMPPVTQEEEQFWCPLTGSPCRLSCDVPCSERS